MRLGAFNQKNERKRGGVSTKERGRKRIGKKVHKAPFMALGGRKGRKVDIRSSEKRTGNLNAEKLGGGGEFKDARMDDPQRYGTYKKVLCHRKTGHKSNSS